MALSYSLLLGKYRGSSLPSSFNKLRSFSSASFIFSKFTNERQILLEVKDLTAVDAESKQEVIKDVNLLVSEGEVHAINNNAAGKNIFLQVLFGDPQYQVTQGSIRYRGVDLVGLTALQSSSTGGLLSFKPIPSSDKDIKKRKNRKRAFCNELQAGVLGNDLGVLDGVQPWLLDDSEIEDVLKGLNNLLLPQCPSLAATHQMNVFKFFADSSCTHMMVDGRIISPPPKSYTLWLGMVANLGY